MIGGAGLIMTTGYYPLALIPGIGAAAILVFFSRPSWFYWAVLFLIPFGQYRFKMDWVIMVGLFCILCLHTLVDKRRFFIRRLSLFPGLAFFFTHFILAGVLSTYPQVVGINIFHFFFSLLFYFYTIYFVKERWHFSQMLPVIIVASVSICSLLAVLGYFFNISYFAENINGGFKRGIGTSRDPNTLALLIIFALPMVSHMIFKVQATWQKLLLTGLLLVQLLAMVTTYSRSGLLVTMIILAFIGFKRLKKIKVKQLGLIFSFLLVFIIALASMIPESYWERPKSLFSKNRDHSIGRRFSYLVAGWESVKKHPVLGTGPGTFPEIYSASPYAVEFSKKDQSTKRFAHNSYIEIVVGTGVVGLVLLVIVLLRAWANYLSARKRAQKQGDTDLLDLIETYMMSYAGLLIYLLTISNPYHKLLMVSLAASEIAVLLTIHQEKE